MMPAARPSFILGKGGEEERGTGRGERRKEKHNAGLRGIKSTGRLLFDSLRCTWLGRAGIILRRVLRAALRPPVISPGKEEYQQNGPA